jgi:hypothetical protein
MIKYVLLTAFGLFVAVATLCKPAFLATNIFIDAFVGDQLLSLLAVIMTITFASVANIHFMLNQIIGKIFAHDVAKGQRAAAGTRKQINDNAWWLFWGFVVCCGLLIVKGIGAENEYVRSAMNGLSLTVLVANILVFYDIYRTIFELASSDIAVRGGSSGADQHPNV